MSKDAIVKCFLKIETSIKAGDPRNISPRSDEFLSIIGPYISAIEHCLRFHPRLVKGMSVEQRDEKLRFLLAFSDFLEGDYARLDMSVSYSYLELVEYQFLCAPFDTDEHWLYRFAMRLAMTTFGVSEIGLSYVIRGTRCSGDAHTSIGNGTINDFNNFICFEPLPIDCCDSVAEGDDGAVGITREYVDQFIYNLHVLPCLGYQIKVDHYISIDQVSFCGRFLVDHYDKMLSTCDLRRALAKIHTICSEGDPESLALAKMISYYCTDSSTPIIGVFVTVVINLLLPKVSKRRLFRAVGHLNSNYWERLKLQYVDFDRDDYPFVAVPSVKRAMIARRTGFSPGMQIRFEEYYKGFLTLGFIPSIIDRLPDDWNFDESSQVYGAVRDYVL